MSTRKENRTRNENQSRRIFLVDGHGLAYRAFYAMIGRPLRTTRGENTSVAYGVTRFILKLLSERTPDYLGFVLDAGRETFRHQIYAPYKATREKLDETASGEFQVSMDRVREVVEALRIPILQVPGYEADDVIGTLAVQAARANLVAVIVSGDTDFYQLIGDDIAVLEPGRGGRTAIEPQWVDAGAARERLGVSPAQVVDFLALVGDPSDNIPGVRGIGPKTAEALLKRYGTLEEVLEHAEEIEPARARQAILSQMREARLSKDLLTIRTDVPVTLHLEDFELREPDRNRLRDLFLELEFTSLIHEFAPRRRQKSSYELLTEPERIKQLAGQIEARGRMGLEVIVEPETCRTRLPAGLAIAVDPGRAFYIPLRHLAGGNAPEVASAEMSPLARILASPKVEKVGHDLKKALLSLRAAGLDFSGPLTDTLLAAYCLDPSRRQFDLDVQVIERFGYRLRSDSEFRARGQSYPDVSAQEIVSYAGERAEMALLLTEDLLADLDRYGQRSLYDDIELPLLPVLAEMEWAGIRVDPAVLETMARNFDREIVEVESEIFRLAGRRFNINSVAELRDVLFKELRLSVKKRKKTGPSTDADVLTKLAEEGHPLAQKLLQYREISKLKSTYVDALREILCPETGRVHTSFHQAGTATGRLSSSDPNLQNIPIRSALGAAIRKAFVPESGFQILVADYSQIELRILAHLSKDPAFVTAFRSGRDIHNETAAHVFNVSDSSITAEMRRTAKMVNYATLYGQGPASLAKRLGITEDGARLFIDQYFQQFPSIRAYLAGVIEQAEQDGYVETLLGRRRYVPELRSDNAGMRGFGQRVARNTPIQGSAADIIKIAMIRIHRLLSEKGARSRMLLQVHDELLFEVLQDETEMLTRLVRTEMENVVRLEVPLVAELGLGPSWYDAKSDMTAGPSDTELWPEEE